MENCCRGVDAEKVDVCINVLLNSIIFFMFFRREKFSLIIFFLIRSTSTNELYIQDLTEEWRGKKKWNTETVEKFISTFFMPIKHHENWKLVFIDVYWTLHFLYFFNWIFQYNAAHEIMSVYMYRFIKRFCCIQIIEKYWKVRECT